MEKKKNGELKGEFISFTFHILPKAVLKVH